MNKRLKRTPDDVLLAGLGALAVAEREGDEFFQGLVKKGKELKKSIELKRHVDSGSSVAKFRAVVLAVLGEPEEKSASASQKRRKAEEFSLLKSTGLPGVSDKEIARRQELRNAAAREEFLSEFGFVALDEIQLGRLKEQGQVFSVEHQGRPRFPSFQFDAEGQPLPVIAQVLSSLGQQSPGWELALWFISSNGWLDGRRPVDLLRSEPEEIAETAEREAEGLFF